MAREKCLNCGCGIGDLETPYLWKERVVCRSCFKKLQPKSGMSKWTMLAAAIVAVGIGAFLIIRSVGPKPAVGEGSSPITAGSQDAAIPSAGNIAPAKPQTNFTSDSVAEELARITAENEKLRQQTAALVAENERLRQKAATALVPTPPPAAPIQAPPRLGSLAGSAWLTTNSGASNLMRGLNVAVLTPTIDSRPIVATALAGIPDLQKEIEACNSMIADEKKLDAETNQPGNADDLLKNDEDVLTADQARIARIQRLASNPPPTLTLEQAYSFLKDGTVTRAKREDEIPSLPLAGIIVKSTKTNVDGKYTITDLAPGNYYVYAVFGSSSMGVDWLVPIQINGGEEKTVDLDNDNAATVRNN
jgi:hypothetical protein